MSEIANIVQPRVNPLQLPEHQQKAQAPAYDDEQQQTGPISSESRH
jgi:hypothetical protein